MFRFKPASGYRPFGLLQSRPSAPPSYQYYGEGVQGDDSISWWDLRIATAPCRPQHWYWCRLSCRGRCDERHGTAAGHHANMRANADEKIWDERRRCDGRYGADAAPADCVAPCRPPRCNYKQMLRLHRHGWRRGIMSRYFGPASAWPARCACVQTLFQYGKCAP